MILVVDPSLKTPEKQGTARVLAGWEGDSRVVQPALRGDGPRPAEGYAGLQGVVVMGSAASAHDDHPWLRDLADWLRPIVSGEVVIPTLGICFGHQLIAKVAGGDVGYLYEDRHKLLAYQESRVDWRLFDEPTPLKVIVSHREEVCDVPDGYRVVGSRPDSRHDALEHESLPVFSVQFHPEARDEFATRVGLDLEPIDAEFDASSDRVLGAYRELVRTWPG